MSCTIIEKEQLSINGSSRLLGGVINGVQLNMSLLTGSHRATVTIIKEGKIVNGTSTSKPLKEPNMGDDFTIDTMGQTFKMTVESYSISRSAGSATTMSLNLVDTSYRILDNNFIRLFGEAPFAKNVQGVKFIGSKYGELPDKDAAEGWSSLALLPDSEWNDLFYYFSDLKASANFFGGGGKLLTPEESKKRTLEYSGKSLYFAYNLPSYVRGKAGYDRIFLLNDPEILQKYVIWDAEIPNGPYSETGSYRSVLNAITTKVGYLAYWDAEIEKVKVTNNFNSLAGLSKVKAIEKSCYVTSSTKNKTFSNTFSKGTAGTFLSSNPGEGGSTSGGSGGKKSRFYRARMLDPDFHYKNPWAKGKKIFTLPLKYQNGKEPDPDLLKAMSAARWPKIYALYVLQSLLVQKDKSPSAANYDQDLELIQKPQDIKNRKITGSTDDNKLINMKDHWNEWFDGDEKFFFPPNKYLAAIYGQPKRSTVTYSVASGEDDDENKAFFNGIVAPIKFKPYSSGNTATANLIKEAAEINKSETPKDFAGTLGVNPELEKDKAQQELKAGSVAKFDNGKLFIHLSNTLSTLIDSSGNLTGEDDPFREYFAAIARFKQNFFVVTEPSALGLRSIKQNNGRTYGYYVTTDTIQAQFKLDSQEYSCEPVSPFVSVNECPIKEIKDLANACAMVYLANDPKYKCPEDFTSQLTVIDFIYALDKNMLKRLFTNPDGFVSDKAGKPMKRQDVMVESEENNEAYGKMFIVKKPVSDPEDPLASETKICYEDGVQEAIVQKSKLGQAIDEICNLNGQFSNNESTINQIFGSWTIKEGALDSWSKIVKEEAENNIAPNKSYSLSEDGKSVNVAKIANLMLLKDGVDNAVGALLPTIELAKSVPKSIKAWFDTESSKGTLKAGNSQFNLFAIKGPKADYKKFWKGVMSDIHVNAADLGLTTEQFQEFLAEAVNEGHPYSDENRALLTQALINKVEENSWDNTIPAMSHSVSVVLSKGQTVSIPSFEEGLESFSLNVQGSKVVASITAGSSYSQAAYAANQALIGENSNLQHNKTFFMPDSFADIPNQNLRNIGRGLK